MHRSRTLITLLCTLSLVTVAPAQVTPAPSMQPPAATAPPSGAAATPAAPAPSGKTFTQQELDQLLAPIALYPDPLIAQILMSATYPLEVVQDDRWLQDPANAAIKGAALEAAVEEVARLREALERWTPDDLGVTTDRTFGGITVAETRRALRVLETSQPPAFYLPADDAAAALVEVAVTFQAAMGGEKCPPD